MLINKLKSGFTIVELLVSIFIITLLLSVVLFNYGTFNDKLALSSAGQEMAIAIRQAQAYGVNVKEVGASGGVFTSAYGVYFNPSCNPDSYYVFADTNANKKYDIGAGCGNPDTAGELIEKFILRNGVIISGVCDAATCPLSAPTKSMHVTFLRPNPDANINFVDTNGSFVGGQSLTGKIRLTSLKNNTLDIVVENTGQVLAQ